MENKEEEFYIDEFIRDSLNIEWKEVSIDLRTCLRGDKLITRDGSTLYYVQPLPISIYGHEVSYDQAGKKLGVRATNGRTVLSKESDSDIIKIVRDE